jgi:hypothetical protein
MTPYNKCQRATVQENNTMGNTFEVNGAFYATDADTLKLLKSYAGTNNEAFGLVMMFGTAWGRIMPIQFRGRK